MQIMQSVDVLAILGLIVGIIGGVLGAFSIFVTWKLYQAGSKLNLQTLTSLQEIRASSKTAEVTSTHFTERLVEGLLLMVGELLKTRVSQAETEVVGKLKRTIEQALSTTQEEQRKALLRLVLDQVTTSFAPVKKEASKLTFLAEPEKPAAMQALATESASAAPSVLPAGMVRLVKWVAQQEPPRNRFLSVKNLHQTKFAGDPELQEALEFALDNNLLETYLYPNPKAPEWPVKACKLNREHPTVKQILGI